MSQSLKLRLTATAAALAVLPLFAGNAVAATHTLDGKTLTWNTSTTALSSSVRLIRPH